MQNLNFRLVCGSASKAEHKIIQPVSVAVKVHIINSVARVEYAQKFYNHTKNDKDVDYLFKIPKNVCIDSISANYNDEFLYGEIMKRENAEKIFKEAQNDGKTVMLGRMNYNKDDILKIKIVLNFEKSIILKWLTVNVAYLEQVESIANKFWRFQVLRNIFGDEQDFMSFSYDSPLIYDEKNSEPQCLWTIDFVIESKSNITIFECPEYKYTLKFTNNDCTLEVKLDPKEIFVPNQNFTIYYADYELSKPKVLLSNEHGIYCSMISFLPENEEISEAKAYTKQKTNDEIKYNDIELDIDKSKGEFIFLLDRSGSMRGLKIKLAIQTLIVFLKSLPPNSCYNIVSFGSNYEIIASISQESSFTNIENTIKIIESLSANMGGTDIYRPLNAVYTNSILKNHPRIIFLLTDGEVSDENRVIDLIERNSSNSTVYSVGIGSECSKSLITASAKAGKGDCEFILDSETNMITNKVMSLLIKSLSKRFVEFSLEDEIMGRMNMMIPSPNEISASSWGTSIEFFCFFEESAFEDGKIPMSFTYKDNKNYQVKTYKIEIKT